jgi:hypothetical protein
MAASDALRVEGLRELQRAFRAVDADLHRGLRKELGDAGNIVRDDERDYLSRIGASSKSIGGIRTRVGSSWTTVEQRYGTVTGKRGDWGARIMSSLAHARAKRRPEVERHLEEMLDRLAVRHGF